MKSITKCGLTCVMGAVVGFVVAKIVLEKKYAERAQEDIDDVKEHYGHIKQGDYKSFINVMRKRGATGEELQILADMFAKYGDRVYSEDTVDEYQKEAKRYSNYSSLDNTFTGEINKEKAKYNLFNKVKNNKEGDMEAINTDEEENEPPEPEDEPYIINETSYSEDFFTHDKSTLRYFAGDNVLIDDQEIIVDDADIILGGCLDEIVNEKWNQRRKTVWYIRNEGIGTDYEILCEPGYYQELILGLKVEDFDSNFNQKKKKGRLEDE